jgi:G3E family GTPase
MFLQAINATAEIIPTIKSDVDLSKIINIQGFSLEKVLKMDPNFLDVSFADPP